MPLHDTYDVRKQSSPNPRNYLKVLINLHPNGSSQQTFVLMKTSWRCLEDVFKTSWWRRIYSYLSYVFRRRLQDVLMKTNIFLLIIRLPKTSSKRLDEGEYILINHTPSEDVFNTSQGRLGQDQYIRLVYTSSRRLQDVFKTSSRRLQDVLPKRLQHVFKTSRKYVLKTSSRRFEDVSSS